ncbi:hypothetical protein EVAR_102257_1 [Eumeta japonica]|uniref:Uncharacterized protein n=1 Tax=Eumeta variegata TaxID=151549 RepID=A0A4C1ZK49_EUMVA|nr:hypothetical protein EVAR_102257_1 [Eumeta japonica]
MSGEPGRVARTIQRGTIGEITKCFFSEWNKLSGTHVRGPCRSWDMCREWRKPYVDTACLHITCIELRDLDSTEQVFCMFLRNAISFWERAALETEIDVTVRSQCFPKIMENQKIIGIVIERCK